MFLRLLVLIYCACRHFLTPMLPRKRRRPNYSIMQFVTGDNETPAHHPESVEDFYRQIFYEAIDSFILSIKTRFDQPSYQVFLNLEQLLLRAIHCEPYEEEFEKMVLLYAS